MTLHLADVAQGGAVLVSHRGQPQLRQHGAALGVVSNGVRLDLANRRGQRVT